MLHGWDLLSKPSVKGPVYVGFNSRAKGFAPGVCAGCTAMEVLISVHIH